MKRILLASSLIVLLIGMASVAPATKMKYTSSEAKLSVTFPAEYSVDESNEDNYRTVKVQSESGGTVFFVNYTVHSESLTDFDELEDVSIQAFSEGLNGSVTSNSDWKVGKNTGKKVMIDVADSGLKGDYRVMFVGQIQYQITAVGPKDAWNEKMVNSFMKSFKLKK
jgi:hypothetical protein